MNYREETLDRLNVDCFWESHEMGNRKEYRYPSLPEPYINLYFPVNSTEPALIKGISSKTDYLSMRSKLFGVRLFLRGYFQLNLEPVNKVSNQLILLDLIGKEDETILGKDISNASSFDERIRIFRLYFEKKRQEYTLGEKETRISEAFQYLVDHYKSSNIVLEYSGKAGISERTLNRWFYEYINIPPKTLARIARFNSALYHLHAYEDPGFYYDYGYFDQAHFIREFKSFTGMAPGAYINYTSDLYNE